MAYTFVGGNTSDINHGSNSSLDNLSTWTYCFWVKPNASISTNDKLAQKGTGSGPNGRRMIETTWHDADQIGVNVRCSSGDTEWESETSWLTTGAWQFLAFTLDLGAGTQIHGYRGTLTSIASESTPAYSAFTGSGLTSEASFDQHIGADASGNNSFYGEIAWVAAWNKVLSLKEIIAQQFAPRVTSGCVLFSHYGFNSGGNETDFSGNGNNGTPTGVSVADHVPMAPLFAYNTPIPYVVSAPAGISIPVVMAHRRSQGVS